jgi:hypothetical protein
MQRKSILVVAIMAAVIALPVVAVAAKGDEKLTIASHQAITGLSSAAGTFAAVGDIDDSGTVESTFSFAPQGSQDAARLTGTQDFVGSLGTFHTTFTGIASPASGVRQVASGTFEVVSGTGAYAGIRGHGTFTVVGDFTTGNIYSVAEGQAHN